MWKNKHENICYAELFSCNNPMGYFKPWATTMGYPIGVPIGVPLYCSIWTSFWNILMSYFIYSVVKAMEPGWSFVKKLDRGKASFSRYWHLTFNPEKPNSYIRIFVSKLQVPCCSPYRGRARFRIVTHCYAASFLRKLILCETNNIFYSREY